LCPRACLALSPSALASFDARVPSTCEQNFWHPSHGWVNSTDGGRGHAFQDYQQQ
jgi:hypothetical protein